VEDLHDLRFAAREVRRMGSRHEISIESEKIRAWRIYSRSGADVKKIRGL